MSLYGNDRQDRRVVRQMRAVSRRAGQYLLADIGRPLQGPLPRPVRTPRRSRTS